MKIIFQYFISICLFLFSMAQNDFLPVEKDYLNNSTESTNSCVCTTVTCPVSGNNYLTESGSTGTYVYATHGSHPVVTSASITITKKGLDTGTATTTCTENYSRTLEDVRTYYYDFACFHIEIHNSSYFSNCKWIFIDNDVDNECL